MVELGYAEVRKLQNGGVRKMEIYTIKDESKKEITELLNRILETEYGFVWNYPRIIDQIVNFHNIHDEQLIRDLEYVGKQSIEHFGYIDKLVVQLGGETTWQLLTIERLANIEDLLNQQLEKEKEIVSLYKTVKEVVRQNRVKRKIESRLARFFKEYGEFPERFIDADDIIKSLDRHIAQEERHARLVGDSIHTFKMLMNKKAV